LGVIERRRKERDAVIQLAKQWTSKLPFKCTVILIGSYARGDFNLWSDVDLLLVGDFHGAPLERLRTLDPPPGFQVIPLTPSEFERLWRRKDPLATEAVSIGVVLRDDYALLQRFAKRMSS